MSRSGPFALLLLAGVLLLLAVSPEWQAALVQSVRPGAAPPGDGLAGALILLGGGLICLGLTGLVRVARIESAWMRFRTALAPIAAERGVDVIIDYPHALWVTVPVDSLAAPLDLRLSPQENPGVDVVCPVTLRFPVVVLPAGLAVRLGHQWSPVAAGPGWRAWSANAERTWRLGQDERLAAQLTAFFAIPGARGVRLAGEGLEVRAALPAHARVEEVGRAALAVAEALYKATAELRG